MAKVQYPPKGGEEKICLSLCALSMLSVITGVLMIYFTVIFYLPAAKVLSTDLKGMHLFNILLNGV